MTRKKTAADAVAEVEAQNVAPLRKAARGLNKGEKLLASIPESGTVTVGLKMPKGIGMRIFKMVPIYENVLGGGSRESSRAEQVGDIIWLKGYAVPYGKRPLFPIIGDFGLTEGVDAAFFREYVKQNIDSDLVQNDLIFCMKDTHEATDVAVERKDLVCGFEPGNPEKDYRAPKRNPSVPGQKAPVGEITKADQDFA